jgi:hypothetical protein
MDQLYLPNLIVNSGTSGVPRKTKLTIWLKLAAPEINPPEIDLVVVVLAPAPELSSIVVRSRSTPDKPIKATVVDSNCSLV